MGLFHFNDAVMGGNRSLMIHEERDERLTSFGKAMMKKSYLLPHESVCQERFATVAAYYSDNSEHAQRLYDAISSLWFMPATPVLSNGGGKRGLPISCFLNEAQDSLKGINHLWNENIQLASNGGGTGSYWGNLRSLGESIGDKGETSGIIPFIRVMDSLTLAISQGSLRRGSAAVYLPVWHPEIEEFTELRRVIGGDMNRRAPNLHHGVILTDDFMKAVASGSEWSLRSPKTKKVIRTVPARDLWVRLLTARLEKGEPYFIFIDNVNRRIPQWHKDAGLEVKTSNLCAEITLPTGIDHLNKMRTAVCCLSSLNLDTWDEWKDDERFIEDVMRFLDNVLTDFIQKAPSLKRDMLRDFVEPSLQEMKDKGLSDEVIAITRNILEKKIDADFCALMDSAIYSASRERSVGLGVMGFHSLLQQKSIPFESPLARVLNRKIFKHIKNKTRAASRLLAQERGPCPDAADYGYMERFSNTTAIAPTASISVICGQVSAGIEPFSANAYLEKRAIGVFEIRNKKLEKVLETYGKNTEEVWSSIMVSEGSAQHLDFLSQQEKDVFKTALEIDQIAVIDLAADRSGDVDQSQSLNIFLPGNVSKEVLHKVHYYAWERDVKSLYYCRSIAVHRAQKVSLGHTVTSGTLGSAVIDVPQTPSYEVCEACQ